jgi:hypothetical protein
MHTSDSENDDGDPEWASDIMQDLAIIAEGKVPPSLEGSENLEELSEEAARTSILWQRSPSPRSKEERQALSKAIAGTLDKIVVPGENLDPLLEKATSIPAVESKDSGSSASTAGKSYKSVFERLISPSHYTGTHKQSKKKHSSTYKQVPEKDAASRLLDEILQSDSEARNSNNDCGTRGSAGGKSDYTQQDVFERLQRNVTQAYAVKHNGTLLPDGPQAFVDDRRLQQRLAEAAAAATASTTMPAPTVPSRDSGYTELDVFERLQNTTTEAYAQKKRNEK